MINMTDVKTWRTNSSDNGAAIRANTINAFPACRMTTTCFSSSRSRFLLLSFFNRHGDTSDTVLQTRELKRLTGRKSSSTSEPTSVRWNDFYFRHDCSVAQKIQGVSKSFTWWQNLTHLSTRKHFSQLFFSLSLFPLTLFLTGENFILSKA